MGVSSVLWERGGARSAVWGAECSQELKILLLEAREFHHSAQLRMLIWVGQGQPSTAAVAHVSAPTVRSATAPHS